MAALRVAVVGAGAAGLCASRFLAAQPDVFHHDVFEMGSNVGGLWVYTDQTTKDSYGYDVHTSMYEHLCTNFPKEVMGFPDFPISDKLPSFISHRDVRAYLKDYAKEFGLVKYVKFNTIVQSVMPLKDNAKTPWRVCVKRLATNKEEVLTYDAVVVCNGHYSTPIVPSIPGANTFHGKILHSHYYRTPDGFRDQTVVCLGAGPSGTDIALELAPYVKRVILSSNNEPFTCEMPSNLEQLAGIESIENGTIAFKDGEKRTADVVMLCTGYEYVYPFLAPECSVEVKHRMRVTPLYKHLLHVHRPSLVFVGLPQLVPPFVIFHYQLQYALKVLQGFAKLPTVEERLADEESEIQMRLDMGLKPHQAHQMGGLLAGYLEDLADLAGVDRFPSVKYAILMESYFKMKQDLMNYKKYNYRIIDEDDYSVTES